MNVTNDLPHRSPVTPNPIHRSYPRDPLQRSSVKGRADENARDELMRSKHCIDKNYAARIRSLWTLPLRVRSPLMSLA
jgi:hypothetical protein